MLLGCDGELGVNWKILIRALINVQEVQLNENSKMALDP